MDKKQSYAVNRLKNYIVDHFDPELIVLYGSTARGDTDEFSDIDMMVIIDAGDMEKIAADIMAGSHHIIQNKHMMVRSSLDYCNRRDIPGTMIFSALREGKVLHRKRDFNMKADPVKIFEDRKMDVIRSEYLDQAREFLKKAETSIEGRRLFRCRDFLKFAAARGLKAVMVFRDIHPSRGTDLEILYRQARQAVAGIEESEGFIRDLNDYCPGSSSPEEKARCSMFLDKTRLFVDSISVCITAVPE